MEIKYFMGFKNVSYEEFMEQKEKAERRGDVVAETRKAPDGLPEYVLRSGKLIRADGQGRFFRVEDEIPVEGWQVGTEDEYVQGETDGKGSADFFFRADDPDELPGR